MVTLVLVSSNIIFKYHYLATLIFCSYPEIGEFCIAKEIQLWLLKPQCTHVTQPLDLSFFGPFKKYVQKYAAAWQHSHPGDSLTKYTLVSQAAYQAMEKCLQNSKSSVVSGWRKSGLFPWQPNNVDFQKLLPSKIYGNDEAHGDTAAGNTVPGHTVPGHTVSGNIVSGNTVPGHTAPGNTVPGHTSHGITGPGDTVLGHTAVDRGQLEQAGMVTSSHPRLPHVGHQLPMDNTATVSPAPLPDNWLDLDIREADIFTTSSPKIAKYSIGKFYFIFAQVVPQE